jgi:APA family basic amino acid/polyamine antiporter
LLTKGTETRTLVRAIGRWSLTAAIVNGVVGSSIFAMPAVVVALAGIWSPVAVLLGGACIFVIVLSFAEVGSRFDQAGGPYLYTREAFGPAIGFQVGWLTIWTRLLSGAAVLNVLTTHLGGLLPAVATPTGRGAAMIGSVVIVTIANVIGVKRATWTTNVFTIAKLLPLALLVVVGGFAISSQAIATQRVPLPRWTDAVLLLVFSYGGFESAVSAAGESRDPRRDTGFALIMAMTMVTALYALVQLVIIGVLPRAAAIETPVATALGVLFGPAGQTFGNAGVVVSTFGWLVGFALMTPRILYAMGNRGELPALFGAVHPHFRTPHAAIIINSAIATAMGLFSSFTQAATLAAIAKLGIYALTCASLIAFRRRRAPEAGLIIAGGPVFAVAGIAVCVWLLTTRDLGQLWLLAALMIAGAAIRGVSGRRLKDQA